MENFTSKINKYGRLDYRRNFGSRKAVSISKTKEGVTMFLYDNGQKGCTFIKLLHKEMKDLLDIIQTVDTIIPHLNQVRRIYQPVSKMLLTF